MTEGKADVKTSIQTGEVLSGSFENILNFRDVGKTVNEFLGEKYILKSSSSGQS